MFARRAGTTAIASLPSISTITVLATSRPGMWADAAASCAVYAGEWLTCTYFVW
jgi:hypothetical protein